MKNIVALLALIVFSTSALADDQTIEINFKDIKADTTMLEPEPGVPYSLEELMARHLEASGSSAFGTWELKGNMLRSGKVFRGDDMMCRIGSERFGCSARVIFENGPDSGLVRAVEVRGESVPLSAFIPGGFPTIEALLGSLPAGSGNVRLIGSTSADGAERVNYFFGEWMVRNQTIASDSSNILGHMLRSSLPKMPFPYNDDLKRSEFNLTSAKATVRYYPLFYTPEIAQASFGDDRRLDEAVFSLEMIVEVPHRFLFVKTPHRYTLKLMNVPVRLLATKGGLPEQEE